jgi:hypothetical protein
MFKQSESYVDEFPAMSGKTGHKRAAHRHNPFGLSDSHDMSIRQDPRSPHFHDRGIALTQENRLVDRITMH